MRLIDADALILPREDINSVFAIACAPTIDTVPIVRCDECKHRDVDGDNVRFNVCELNHNKVQSDDWFCADGERKEEDE